MEEQDLAEDNIYIENEEHFSHVWGADYSLVPRQYFFYFYLSIFFFNEETVMDVYTTQWKNAAFNQKQLIQNFDHVCLMLFP